MIENIKSAVKQYKKETWKTETDIASMLGVRESTVYRWVRTNGVGMHKREEKALRKILEIK